MFILGVIVGIVIAGGVGYLTNRRQAAQIAKLESERSGQFRRITALEKSVADVRIEAAKIEREWRLRGEREFRQYKILLRRADKALAQARAQRDQRLMSDAA